MGALVAVSNAYLVTFDDFLNRFGKNYTSIEETSYRKGVFDANVAHVNKLNEELRELGKDQVHGVTKFMDLTPAEFKSQYLNYIPNSFGSKGEVAELPEPTVTDVDWRTKGVLTPVKDQGRCGSCWAFSATEAIESFSQIAHGTLHKLSPQQINSCDKSDGGCNGGNTETAYEYVHKAGGMELESDYPYTSGSTGITGTCKSDPSKYVAGTAITGYKTVMQGESYLASALENLGPVSVCLAADAFQTYSGGILSRCPGFIDHCVQAVGYTADYWIVRNSWNTDWGEDGFIRIERGSNLCKIQNDVTYPVF